MPRIRQLPPQVVSKIAAGEVIERPASVVKELVENAVDAGATRIDIDLEQGGAELIRVVDDGCGIAANDLPLALASHATSKLTDADDLFRITTMGFRGEALASIGGVAKLTLQSRPPDQTSGAEIRCDGGELSPVRPWNGAPGTRIEVRHLFYNVPVRKKFLKSIATELGHIGETVTRLALANPALHLTLRHNGKLVYEIPATAGLTERIALFFGGDVRDALYYLDTGPDDVQLTGYIADPACDRGNAKLQYLFVNGRWVRDRSLTHALQEAYRGLLMTGRYAVAFLFLTVLPDQVDVNVHPTKAEVRFRDGALVYSRVRSAVKSRLLKENLVPRLEVPRPQNLGSNPEMFPPVAARRPVATFAEQGTDLSSSPFTSIPRDIQERLPLEPMPTLPLTEPRAAVDPLPKTQHPELSTLNLPSPFPFPPTGVGTALQVHDAYLVVETPQGMLVIDQHALHERILYEQLRRRIRDGKLDVQRLLIPEPIDLPAEQAALVLEAAPALAELGLEVSDFGGNTVLLSSYPTLLARRPPYEILAGVIDYLVTKDRTPTKDALLNDLLATMACKAAVKAGDRLSPEEIAYLLQLRELAEDSHHCPHGRPTSLLFSRQDLDRQFRRI
jgi:DNA mismatch repair protein MutL